MAENVTLRTKKPTKLICPVCDNMMGDSGARCQTCDKPCHMYCVNDVGNKYHRRIRCVTCQTKHVEWERKEQQECADYCVMVAMIVVILGLLLAALGYFFSK